MQISYVVCVGLVVSSLAVGQEGLSRPGIRHASDILLTMDPSETNHPISTAQQVGESTTTLRIVIVESGKQINNIKARTAREVLVQVEDENRRPVGSAIVTATLPEQGPSGVFVNGGKSFIGSTGPDGRMRFTLRPNRVPGQFQIKVAASAGGKTAAVTIAQANVVAAAVGLSTAAVVAIVAGAAAAAGVAVAVGGSGGTQAPSPTPPRPPSISIGAGSGPVVIGAP